MICSISAWNICSISSSVSSSDCDGGGGGGDGGGGGSGEMTAEWDRRQASCD
jgi:hypothetical protein